MSTENHTVLLEYTDSDGDDLRIIHDPLDGDAEDILIYTHCNEPGFQRRLAVRVPLDVLRQALTRVSGLCCS